MRKLRYVGSFLGEMVQFARQNKVYWIVPFVLILALVVLLVVTGQAASPFLYTLF
jgi:ABC-type microcin C transport system permease subunit YejE